MLPLSFASLALCLVALPRARAGAASLSSSLQEPTREATPPKEVPPKEPQRPAPERPRDPFTSMDVAAALERGLVEKRLVLLELVRGSDPTCAAAQARAWSDVALVEWVFQHTLGVRLDLDKPQTGERTFASESVPMLVMLDTRGGEIGRVELNKEPDKIRAELSRMYEDRGGIALAKRAVEDAPQDPHAHYQLARAMHLRRVEESVAAYFAAWDLRENSAEFKPFRAVLPRQVYSMVRNSASIVIELRKRRDWIVPKLLAGDPKLDDALDLAAIDDAMGDAGHLIEIIDMVNMGKPAPSEVLRALATERVLTNLLSGRRYELLSQILGDELVNLDRDFSAYAAALQKHAETSPAPSMELRSTQGNLMRRACLWYEVNLGLDQPGPAQQVADLTLLHLPSASVYVQLCSVANKFGKREAVQQLYKQGMDTLPKGPDRERLRKVVGVAILGEPE